MTENDGTKNLFAAVLDDDTATIKHLVQKGANVNGRDDVGYSPLHLAAQERASDSVRALLDLGADPEARDERGNTPLHVAAGTGHDTVVRYLVDRGANIEATNNDGETALHAAVAEANDAARTALIQRGANVNATDNFKRTPLHLAAYNNDEFAVESLLRSGANPVARDAELHAPIDYLEEGQKPQVEGPTPFQGPGARNALTAAVIATDIPSPQFTRRDIHSALLVADATLAKGTREDIPVLRLLDAERAAARQELAGKVTSAEAALHAELVAHRLIDQVRENPFAAATVGEQLRTHGVLNARPNSRTNEDRAPETIALVSAYKATQFTERGVANRLATQAFESLKTMASMGQTIDQSAKPEPDRLQAILSSARGHVSNMIEQQAQRGGRSNEMTR